MKPDFKDSVHLRKHYLESSSLVIHHLKEKNTSLGAGPCVSAIYH
jgi:hypothetical protein